MGKVIVDFYQGPKYYFKANEDVIAVAKKCGYTLHLLQISSKEEFLQNKKSTILRSIQYNFKKIKPFINGIQRIPKQSNVLLVYPLPFGYFTKLFCKLLHKKGCFITTICIDVNSFRNMGNRSKDVNNLNAADALILHTPNMEKSCREINIKTPVNLIYLFDYLTNDLPSSTNGTQQFRIAFAGSFSKAPFIHKLTTLTFKHEQTCFYLYGSADKNLQTNDRIHYKGRFAPDKISELMGDWGLVWDGDSLDDCKDIFGNYLKINSPLKTSLYLASNLPVIMWKHAGLASFIEEHTLGITVNSIHEIEDKILNLTSAQIEEIRTNVSIYSEKIRNGEMLSSILTDDYQF